LQRSGNTPVLYHDDPFEIPGEIDVYCVYFSDAGASDTGHIKGYL